MSDIQEDHKTQELIRQAEDLIRQAELSLEASDKVLRDMGLDPDKVRGVLAEQSLTAEQQQEAQALFQKDMDDIDQTVQQEAAYARHRAVPRTGGGAKMGRMV